MKTLESVRPNNATGSIEFQGFSKQVKSLDVCKDMVQCFIASKLTVRAWMVHEKVSPKRGCTLVHLGTTLSLLGEKLMEVYPLPLSPM
jgi:hypothetical protein